MTELRKIRIGIFDQIVSGGGVRFFTTRLAEEFSRQAGDRWHFHLMWPFFDSSDNLLAPPSLPHTSFERVETDRALRWPAKLSLTFDDVIQRRRLNVQGNRALLRLGRYVTNIRQNEQRKFRSGNGAGLRWLDARMSNFDLIFMPYPYLTLPLQGEWQPSKPVVITLHDLAHEFTDTWGETTTRLRHEIRAWTQLAKVVIFSSDFVRNEAQKLYGLPSERARTILLAPTRPKQSHRDSRVVLRRYGLKEGYLFTIGWAAKHKRVETIIKGFALFRARSAVDTALVIAGPGTESLRNKDLSGLQMGKDVFALGYVSDKDIPALYENAGAIVTASASESGLSTVIFDAVMHERAIICSNIPPFVERLGCNDTLAIVFDGDSPQALANALLKHFEDPGKAEIRIKEAKRLIGKRTLSDVARDYLEAFESALQFDRKEAGRRKRSQ